MFELLSLANENAGLFQLGTFLAVVYLVIEMRWVKSWVRDLQNQIRDKKS